MKKYITQLARDLMEDHPGIPEIDISQELCESFIRVLRKHLVKDGVVILDDFGKIYVKRFKGTNKKDPKTRVIYKTTPRNVVKFEAVKGLNFVLNTQREK